MADEPLSPPPAPPSAPPAAEGASGSSAGAAAAVAPAPEGTKRRRKRKEKVHKPKISHEERLRRRRSLKAEFLNPPNLITLARVALIPLFTYACARGDAVGGVVAAHVFGLAAAMDALDGWLARRMNLVTTVGKFMDPLADKLMVMASLLILVDLHRVPAWAVIASLAREFIVTGLRTIAVGEGLVISASQGGKWKTGLQLTGLVGLIIHYPYPVWFGVGTWVVNFHQAGLVMLYMSLVPAMTSMVGYFKGFLDEVTKREVAIAPKST